MSESPHTPTEGEAILAHSDAANCNWAAVSDQAASAWLTCWSICRMLANVQVLPGFIGDYSMDKTCWLG